MFIMFMHACTAFKKIVSDEIQHLTGGQYVVNETSLSLHSAHKTSLPQVTSSQRRQLHTVIIPVERIQLIEILGQGTMYIFIAFYTA